MMYLRDAETGEQMWVDTSDKKLREAYEKYAFVREKELDAIFKRSGVMSLISVPTKTTSGL